MPPTIETDLQTYLEQQRKAVDHALDAYLPTLDTRPRRLHEAMRYSVMAGGKRLRPILCLVAAEAAGGQREDALYPALAIELLHTYTLIHDDLPCMDDDALRRGMPTCHIRFGEATAVLAGDALLTMAFDWIAREGDTKLVACLAKAGGSTGVIGGQVEDLAAEDQVPDEEMLDYIHRHKTAALIRASVEIGGLSAGVDAPGLKALGDYGERIGLAFQIIDDILDVTADTETLGKTAGSDEANNKMTYVALHGIDEARNQARLLTEEATQIIAASSLQGERLEQIAASLTERTY